MTEQLHFHFSLSCIGEGNGNPLQCSCLENPRGGRAWWAAVYGVAQTWTRLKRLSSSSSSTVHRPNPTFVLEFQLSGEVALSTPKAPHWRSSSPGSLVPTHAGKPSSTSAVTRTHTRVTVNSGSLGPSVHYCCSSAVSNFPSLYPLLADMVSPTLARDGLRSFLPEAYMELLSLHPPKGTSGGPLQSSVQATILSPMPAHTGPNPGAGT